jgi:hypothetical protein
MSMSKPRLSLEELGLFNILASVEKGQDIDAFLLQGVQTRGFVTLGRPVVLTSAGASMLRGLAARLEAEALGEASPQRSLLDPRITREIPVNR